MEGLLGDSPEDRVDVRDIGDPRGIDRNSQPGRAGNDSKKDKQIQSVPDRQARDKPQAVPSALNRKDHGRCRNGPRGEGGTWHQAKGEECATNENGDSYDSQRGAENTDVPGGRFQPYQSSSE
jgi:hypothetical protein